MRGGRRVQLDEAGEILIGEALPVGRHVRIDAVINAEHAERLRRGQRIRVGEVELHQVAECGVLNT